MEKKIRTANIADGHRKITRERVNYGYKVITKDESVIEIIALATITMTIEECDTKKPVTIIKV